MGGEILEDTRDLISIRKSDIDEMRNFSAELQVEHWQEIATNKRVMKLDPNWHAYYEMEERGLLAILAAWVDHDQGEQMVGYTVNTIGPHLHYRKMTYLVNDVLFVTQEHRRTRLGLTLIEKTEDLGRDRECEMIAFHGKYDTALGKILEARGYTIQDIVYSKVL